VPGGITVNLQACKDPATPPEPAPSCTTPPTMTVPLPGAVQDLTTNQCTRWEKAARCWPAALH
jgi:hypothetical protein